MLKRIRALFKRRDGSVESAAASVIEAADAIPATIHRGPDVVHRPIPIQDLDPDAVKIVRRLTRFDHTAYLVGGCVRDLLLDRKPKDYDIGTSATPRQIKRAFRNCRIIGRRFRLAHIYFHNGKVIEVATFRSRDGDDASGEETGGGDLLIRDDNVFGTPEDDALRRDFTINALFYDVNTETVLDHAGGLDDLRRRYVRAIGDADIRFREDPIRILRAIKFAARLDFEIEEETRKALLRNRGEIPKAASPRILEEINRFCRGGAARRSFELMRQAKVFEVVLPEFEQAYHGDRVAWNRMLDLMDGIDRRHEEGHEAATGEILAAMVLPLIAERMGWKDGKAEPPKGTNVRKQADELLRPMATRLRVARKDQESCRQILMTLYRMVPHHRVRRNTRRSILQRECLPAALWMLGVWAARHQGAFQEALEHWSRAARERRPGGVEAKQATREGAPRKSERRGGRRRGKRREGAEPAAAPKPELPSPWDERYFFAALPSVPDLGEASDGDRYGTAARAVEPSGTGDEPTGEKEPQRPRRRRGRRGGRRRRRRKTGDGSENPKGP